MIDTYLDGLWRGIINCSLITRQCDFVSSGKYLSDLNLYKSALYKITIYDYSNVTEAATLKLAFEG